MAHREGDVIDAMQFNKETTTIDAEMKLEFFKKLSEIPVVNAVQIYGTTLYQRVKQMNRFTSSALSVTETTASYFVAMAENLFEKMQPQVQLVDRLACLGLDTVETNVPSIMKPPELLVEDARKVFSTIDSGHEKIVEMKSTAAQTLTWVKNKGLGKAHKALSGVEDLVDKYLPPVVEELQEAEDDKTVVERISALTNKIAHRVYGNMLILLRTNNLDLKQTVLFLLRSTFALVNTCASLTIFNLRLLRSKAHEELLSIYNTLSSISDMLNKISIMKESL